MHYPQSSDCILLEKIEHRGQARVFLKFRGRSDWLKKIKKLRTIQYSRTHGSWYLPLKTDSYQDFKRLHIPYRIIPPTDDVAKDIKDAQAEDISHLQPGTTDRARSICDPTGIVPEGTDSVTSPTGKEENADIQEISDKEIVFNGSSFYLKMPYDKEDVDLVKSLKATWWNDNSKTWVIKASVENLSLLQAAFTLWDEDTYQRTYQLVSKLVDPVRVELYRTAEHPKQVAVKILGYKADIDFMKHIPERYYDKCYKRWLIPYDEHIVKRIIDHYTSLGAEVSNRLPKSRGEYLKALPSLANRQQHLLAKIHDAHRGVLKSYTDTLIAQRYSWRTIQSYTGAFVKYIRSVGSKTIDQHTVDDVNGYLSNMAGHKVSESSINRAYSAIKFYFEKVVFRPDFEIKKMKRPRKGKYLPTILSVQEVSRILSSTGNLKHTTILYTLYSGGLRLEELLSLRVDDILWDRNQILIKSGKGKKDRMVMLSQTLKEVLQRYSEEYQPEYWLFEGHDRKKNYSRTSVQMVVRRAAKAAGITKKVTPHTLRHCFATHLMDKGTGIRYIQELLGHKDIKTTLIYTHVTNAQATAIQSPLDELRLNDKKD